MAVRGTRMARKTQYYDVLYHTELSQTVLYHGGLYKTIRLNTATNSFYSFSHLGYRHVIASQEFLQAEKRREGNEIGQSRREN